MLPIVSLACLSMITIPLVACASSSSNAPGPMRPLEPDVSLDEAAPIDINDQPAMDAWLAVRVAAAKAGQRERVRLPVVRRADAFGCDCPSYAVAPTAANGPFYWLTLMDMTSAGIPPGEWVGWVDGRFTGAMRTYRSIDTGGSDVVTPVFEVLRQSRRGPDDVPAARFVRDDR